MRKVIHFKGLNGIRAIAAVVVMFTHILGDLGQFGLKKLPSSLNIASLGVTIFFYIKWIFDYLFITQRKSSKRKESNKYFKFLHS